MVLKQRSFWTGVTWALFKLDSTTFFKIFHVNPSSVSSSTCTATISLSLALSSCTRSSFLKKREKGLSRNVGGVLRLRRLSTCCQAGEVRTSCQPAEKPEQTITVPAVKLGATWAASRHRLLTALPLKPFEHKVCKDHGSSRVQQSGSG